MEKSEKHNLNFDLTHPYIEDMLTHSNRLSHYIKKNCDLKLGTLYTLLPQRANLKALYLFNNGGIIPQYNERKVIDFFGTNAYFQETTSTRENMEDYVHNYLKQNNTGTVVVEEVIRKKRDDFSDMHNTSLSYTNNEVYYVLNSKNTSKEITKALRRANGVWHFVVILIPHHIELSEELTEVQMELLTSSIQSMIVVAYDGESYIFWEKQE